MQAFNYEEDAKNIRESMKGAGTSEEIIINITGKRNNAQRQLIRSEYKALFGRDILEDFEDELDGSFKTVVIGMYMSPVEYDVTEIRETVEGSGTNEDILTEIIGSRSTERLQNIIKLYKERYNETLEQRIKDEASEEYKNLIVSLLQCKRNESNMVHLPDALKDVEALFQGGQNKWGTDDELFNRIFAMSSSAHLTTVSKHYLKEHGKNLLDVVDSEFSGDIQVLLKTILQAHVNPAEYFAERIYRACKGCGTNDSQLIRALITTDEEILEKIRAIYKSKYGMTLEAQIDDECSGDYKSLLIELVSR